MNADAALVTVAAAGMRRAAATATGMLAAWCLFASVSAEEGPGGVQLTIAAGVVQIEITGDDGIEVEEVVVEAVEDGPGAEFKEIEEEVQVAQPDAPRPLGGLFGAGLRAIFEAVATEPQVVQPPLTLDETDDGELPRDPRQAQLWQQRKQIRQQAKHMEQALQPALRTELEMVRQSCGSLSPEARRQVLAAGRAAVTSTALKFATRQMSGGRRQAFDTRHDIQESLAKAVKPHVSAAEFAAYEREQQLRRERRQRAARVVIVAKLDRRLDLAEAQRRAIEADLEQHWEPSWVRGLDDRQTIMNNERPAPDYADACIAPHLDRGQQVEWVRWRKAAGSAVAGMHSGGSLDGLGLHQEDPWWTK
ncbi:MAG: hypothetical protein WD060_06880 [Pirellulales bacterium]